MVLSLGVNAIYCCGALIFSKNDLINFKKFTELFLVIQSACLIFLNASKKCKICVSSYVSKEKRDEGFDPIDSVDITVPTDDYDLFLDGNIFSASYNWLKENVEGFEDATDD